MQSQFTPGINLSLEQDLIGVTQGNLSGTSFNEIISRNLPDHLSLKALRSYAEEEDRIGWIITLRELGRKARCYMVTPFSTSNWPI